MALIKIESDSSTFFTPVPNKFIDEYLPSANPAYVTVYIFLYRHTFHKEDIDTQHVSSTLNLLESDIINALKYWEQQGILKLSSASDNFTIEFLEVSSKNSPKSIPQSSTSMSETVTPLLLETKPDYSVEEINMYMGNSREVSDMIAFAGRCLGKHMNYNDVKTIYGFYDWLRLPFDVIRFLFEYCCLDLEQRRLRYIETVALDWHDNNIETVKAAKEYVRQYSDHRKILKAFGISNADATPKQIEFMNKWLEEFKMPIEIIVQSANKTIETIGHHSFKYANTILTDWNDKNIRTIEGIEEEDKKFREQQTKKINKQHAVNNPAITIKPTRFVNFQQSDWEFDEAMEDRYIEEQLRRG